MIVAGVQPVETKAEQTVWGLPMRLRGGGAGSLAF
jgi:hypothetical protein